MNTTLIIILVLAVAAGVIWVSTKYFGLFADSDKDGIPDEVEDAVEDVKATAKEVKRRAKRVKEELSDIGDAVKEVGKQASHVTKATKSSEARPGRKPAAKK